MPLLLRAAPCAQGIGGDVTRRPTHSYKRGRRSHTRCAARSASGKGDNCRSDVGVVLCPRGPASASIRPHAYLSGLARARRRDVLRQLAAFGPPRRFLVSSFNQPAHVTAPRSSRRDDRDGPTPRSGQPWRSPISKRSCRLSCAPGP